MTRDLLQQLEPVMAGAARVHLKAGQQVFVPGAPCANYLMVEAGSVRVSTVTESGRDLLLYRVGPGEACVVTTTCLLNASDYEVFGVAETDVEALVLPKAQFDALLAASTLFRRYVFGQYGERLQGLIALVQEVADRQVDRRLARFLAEQAADGAVHMTHQAIAAELGTAREVVSRLLKDFSAQGLVVIERGKITIRDGAALSHYVAGM